MDYYAYWGLKSPPFALTPDPTKLFLGRRHSECLLRLKYAVTTNKGGALLVSENAGDGKTSVLKLLTSELDQENPGVYHTAFVSHPTLTPRQMITEIARQTGCDIRRRDKMRTLNEFRDYLEELAAKGHRALVIVDEGQMLARRPDVLDELRTLLNFCAGEKFLLSFILSGQRPLEAAIRNMPEFWQRLPVRYFLSNLNAAETRLMINHRLALAGLPEGRALYTDGACESIFRFSQGCPRVVCSVADLALVIGQSRRVNEVDVPEVEEAITDMERPGASSSFHYFRLMKKTDGDGAAQRPDKAPQRRTCPSCGGFLSANASVCSRCACDVEASNRLRGLLDELRRLKPGAKVSDPKGLILHLPRRRWSLRAPATVVAHASNSNRQRHFKAGLLITTEGVTFEGSHRKRIDRRELSSVDCGSEGDGRMVLSTRAGMTYEVNIARTDERSAKLLDLAGRVLAMKVQYANGQP